MNIRLIISLLFFTAFAGPLPLMAMEEEKSEVSSESIVTSDKLLFSTKRNINIMKDVVDAIKNAPDGSSILADLPFSPFGPLLEAMNEAQGKRNCSVSIITKAATYNSKNKKSLFRKLKDNKASISQNNLIHTKRVLIIHPDGASTLYVGTDNLSAHTAAKENFSPNIQQQKEAQQLEYMHKLTTTSGPLHENIAWHKKDHEDVVTGEKNSTEKSVVKITPKKSVDYSTRDTLIGKSIECRLRDKKFAPKNLNDAFENEPAKKAESSTVDFDTITKSHASYVLLSSFTWNHEEITTQVESLLKKYPKLIVDIYVSTVKEGSDSAKQLQKMNNAGANIYEFNYQERGKIPIIDHTKGLLRVIDGEKYLQLQTGNFTKACDTEINVMQMCPNDTTNSRDFFEFYKKKANHLYTRWKQPETASSEQTPISQEEINEMLQAYMQDEKQQQKKVEEVVEGWDEESSQLSQPVGSQETSSSQASSEGEGNELSKEVPRDLALAYENSFKKQKTRSHYPQQDTEKLLQDRNGLRDLGAFLQYSKNR